jgi:hypothetical protein
VREGWREGGTDGEIDRERHTERERERYRDSYEKTDHSYPHGAGVDDAIHLFLSLRNTSDTPAIKRPESRAVSRLRWMLWLIMLRRDCGR